MAVYADGSPGKVAFNRCFFSNSIRRNLPVIHGVQYGLHQKKLWLLYQTNKWDFSIRRSQIHDWYCCRHKYILYLSGHPKKPVYFYHEQITRRDFIPSPMFGKRADKLAVSEKCTWYRIGCDEDQKKPWLKMASPLLTWWKNRKTIHCK